MDCNLSGSSVHGILQAGILEWVGSLDKSLYFCLLQQFLTCSLFFPSGTSGKESACQCMRHKRCRFNPWVRKIPWRRKWQANPIFLPGKSYGQRSQAGYLLHMHTHTAHSAAKGDKGAFLTPHSLDSGVRETILNNQYYVKWYIDWTIKNSETNSHRIECRELESSPTRDTAITLMCLWFSVASTMDWCVCV